MKTAVLILDMLSEFRFPNGAALERAAARIAPDIARLAARARKAGVSVIYINDTAGQWESDQREFLARCLRGPGAGIAELLLPHEQDYFMFKPMHSAFYGTPLAELLNVLHVKRIVLTGQSSHQCVLVTASDAHIRGLDVVVASDCIAAAKAVATRHATYVLQHGFGSAIDSLAQSAFCRTLMPWVIGPDPRENVIPNPSKCRAWSGNASRAASSEPMTAISRPPNPHYFAFIDALRMGVFCFPFAFRQLNVQLT